VSSGAEACATNIGPRGIRLRRRIGLAGFAAGAALGLWLVLSHAPFAWRVFALGPFLIGALGWLQARERTCVSNAARGLRDPDADPLPGGVERADVDAAIGRRALSIRLRAFAIALALTALLFALPA
jgi:hypothetical protein